MFLFLFLKKRRAFSMLPSNPGHGSFSAGLAWLSSTLPFFQPSQYLSLPVSRPPVTGQLHAKGEELLARFCSQHQGPTSQGPTVPPGDQRGPVSLSCALWVPGPAPWMEGPRKVWLWLDSVFSALKWWVDHSDLPATICRKRKALINRLF